MDRGEDRLKKIYTYIPSIGLLLFCIVCISIAIVILLPRGSTSEPIQFITQERGDDAQSTPSLTIDIEGGVVRPGVYIVHTGAHIQDVIDQAGGISSQASTKLVETSINRAQLVRDGAKIYIPTIVDEETSHNIAKDNNDSTLTSHNINQNIEAGSVISINSASQEELESLSGIGPVMAARIISGRPYKTIDELVTKKAVGQKVLEKIQANLSL